MTTVNTMRPGLPGYTGPVTGLFALLHHGILFEWSHNVMERVDYVLAEKSPGEVPIRLHSMLYLGDCPALDAYGKAWEAYDKASEAYGKASEAYDKASEAYVKASEAYGKAREAYVKAWDAYDKAWEAVDQVAVLAYIRKHVPDCRWDGKELRFN